MSDVATQSDVLDVRGLSAGYGRLQILSEITLSVRSGETVILLGANGAGKSTLLRAVAGLLPAKSGSIELVGRSITDEPAHRRSAAGIAYMSEVPIFADLSVSENLEIGARRLHSVERQQWIKEIFARFPILEEKRHKHAGGLSGGQRKMLGLAKCLVGNPRLMLLDEPSAGLSPLFVTELVRALASLATKGTSILLAEQNVAFLSVADRAYTLDSGRIAFEGSVADLKSSDAVRRAYFSL